MLLQVTIPVGVPMKSTAVLLLLSCLTPTVIANVQSSQGVAKLESEIRDYWVDPSTELMWARKDNGRDVSWKGAVKYCGNLKLAGYSDWRLPSVAELRTIYDRNANAPGMSGKDAFTYHVKGKLFLTGDEWSSDRINDDRGHPSGYEWYFDFNEGRSNSAPGGFPYPHSLYACTVRTRLSEVIRLGECCW